MAFIPPFMRSKSFHKQKAQNTPPDSPHHVTGPEHGPGWGDAALPVKVSNVDEALQVAGLISPPADDLAVVEADSPLETPESDIVDAEPVSTPDLVEEPVVSVSGNASMDMTKVELVDLAKSLGIKVTPALTKQGLVDAINAKVS